jgi:hypothetical protein
MTKSNAIDRIENFDIMLFVNHIKFYVDRSWTFPARLPGLKA